MNIFDIRFEFSVNIFDIRFGFTVLGAAIKRRSAVEFTRKIAQLRRGLLLARCLAMDLLAMDLLAMDLLAMDLFVPSQ